VEALLDGPLRFSDLLERVPGLAPNILSDRLRRMRRVGILVARPYSQRPIRMAYALTADARDLAGALRLLADWGARGAGSEPGTHEPLRHAACGTPLETRSYCPTCTVVVHDPEAGEDRLV
jgi:DNA-binding HxlR family transcriptional regulator